MVAGELKAAKVIRAETIWAHFVAKNNLPFAISDTFTKMASQMFPDSAVAKCFEAGRTKTTQIVKCGLARHQDDLVTKLCQTQVLSHIYQYINCMFSSSLFCKDHLFHRITKSEDS